jgi:hypothetical protein
LPGKENNGKDVAETALSGAAVIKLTATKASVLEASAAKFKGVKHLEQVVNVPAAKTNNSIAATKEDATMMEDGKQAVGQKRKRAHDPDIDADI